MRVHISTKLIFKNAPFSGKFLGIMSELSLGTCMSNLKSVALTVLELLAFNVQKFRGSRDPGHVPFANIFGDHVGCPESESCPYTFPPPSLNVRCSIPPAVT